MLRGIGNWRFAVLLAGAGLAFAPVTYADGPQEGDRDEKRDEKRERGPREKRPMGPPSAEKIFDMIDTDKDGSISKEEFTKAHKKRMERMRKRFGSHGPPHRHAHHGPPRGERGECPKCRKRKGDAKSPGEGRQRGQEHRGPRDKPDKESDENTSAEVQ